MLFLFNYEQLENLPQAHLFYYYIFDNYAIYNTLCLTFLLNDSLLVNGHSKTFC